MSTQGRHRIGLPRKHGGFLRFATRFACGALLGAALIGQGADASARRIDDYRWEGIDRIVAIGDIHGDYGSYMAALQAAGVVDARGRWIAGQTHLVQTGDIPDRGPDTRRIIAHMQQLAKQARRQGGMVHNLMGNHEAMNVYGDLRYVSPGEYQAFATRDSEALRDRYFTRLLEKLESEHSSGGPPVPEDFKRTWEATHPPGWIEHQQAWNPAWNPRGEYYRWVLREPVAIQLNDLIFVHGGISGAYCRNSLESLARKAHAALRDNDPQSSGILTDPQGPLWYRGLSGVAPTASPETVAAILSAHGARHIVVGHTPTGGAIWPRYDGRVVQIDVGMSAVYGGHVAYLEATHDGLFAGYRTGKVRLPQDDAGRVSYLEKVIALQGEDPALEERLAALKAAPAAADGADDTAAGAADTAAAGASGPAAEAQAPPICGISP